MKELEFLKNFGNLQNSIEDFPDQKMESNFNIQICNTNHYQSTLPFNVTKPVAEKLKSKISDSSLHPFHEDSVHSIDTTNDYKMFPLTQHAKQGFQEQQPQFENATQTAIEKVLIIHKHKKQINFYINMLKFTSFHNHVILSTNSKPNYQYLFHSLHKPENIIHTYLSFPFFLNTIGI